MTDAKDKTVPTPSIDDAAQDWFLRLASGEASEADLDAFKAWCATDPRHRIAYEEVHALWNDIGALQPAFVAAGQQRRVPDTAPQRARAAVPRQAAPSRTTGRAGRKRVFGGVVAAGLAVAAVFLADLPTRLTADHRTAVGEQARVTLPDGSLVTLNTDTAVSVDYSESRRAVSLLRGEAHFEVVANPARPFTVLALGGSATATGTAFVVRDHGASASVVVTEGAVAVSSPRASPQSPASLRAGQRVHYREGRPPGPAERADVPAAAAWREGALLVKGLPLDQAIAEIDRYLPGRVLLLAETADLEPVTARLSLQSLDTGLKALATTHGLSVTQVTGYLTIIR